MTPERERAPSAQIPHLDRRIHTPAREHIRIVIKAHDAGRVTAERADALPAPPVPHFERVVHAARDELDVVELQRPDGARVAAEAVELDARVHVPDTHGAVVRAADKDGESGVGEGFVELETHDAVCVAFEGADGAPAAAPVPLDGHAFAVDVFPRTGGRQGGTTGNGREKCG